MVLHERFRVTTSERSVFFRSRIPRTVASLIPKDVAKVAKARKMASLKSVPMMLASVR